eukprot:1743311-Pleurochrysis_carterae.AAC.1
MGQTEELGTRRCAGEARGGESDRAVCASEAARMPGRFAMEQAVRCNKPFGVVHALVADEARCPRRRTRLCCAPRTCAACAALSARVAPRGEGAAATDARLLLAAAGATSRPDRLCTFRIHWQARETLAAKRHSTVPPVYSTLARWVCTRLSDRALALRRRLFRLASRNGSGLVFGSGLGEEGLPRLSCCSSGIRSLGLKPLLPEHAEKAEEVLRPARHLFIAVELSPEASSGRIH